MERTDIHCGEALFPRLILRCGYSGEGTQHFHSAKHIEVQLHPYITDAMLDAAALTAGSL
jgi:hypothetical protein